MKKTSGPVLALAHQQPDMQIDNRVNSSKSQKDDQFGKCYINGEKPPFIKPQKYDLSFDYYETIKLFGGRSHKLVLWFRIITQGEYFGILLPRYYNVYVVGKPCKYGNFKVGWKCNFIREYTNLFPSPPRLDRVSLTPFKGVIIEGKVRTVTRGFNQISLSDVAQYSVIGELCKIKKL